MNNKIIYWHKDSPDAGHPDCICDVCKKPILEGDAPIRMWDNDAEHEVRFHSECGIKVLEGGYEFRYPEPTETKP